MTHRPMGNFKARWLKIEQIKKNINEFNHPVFAVLITFWNEFVSNFFRLVPLVGCGPQFGNDWTVTEKANRHVNPLIRVCLKQMLDITLHHDISFAPGMLLGSL